MKKTILGLGGAHLILILGAIGVIGGGAFWAKHNPTPKTSGIYCTQEGLSDEMPIQSHRSYCIKSGAETRTFSTNTPGING